MAETTKDSVNVVLLVDRFVSASTATDVVSALESLLSALQKQQLDATTLLEETITPTQRASGGATAADQDEAAFWPGLLHLLQTQETLAPANLPVGDEGANLVARLYLQLLSSNSKAVAQQLLETAHDRLLPALVDVATADTDREEQDDEDEHAHAPSSLYYSSYTRVVCLQTLRQLCTAAPKTAQAQLLQAPAGLHRLGLLLGPQNSDVAVRNEALLLAAQPLATWAAVAKVWMFQDVGLSVLQLAVSQDMGGLTGGNVLVVDCLRLLAALLQHDTQMADLLWANHGHACGRIFCQLIDLRLGTAFLHPEQASQQAPLSRHRNSNNKKKKEQEEKTTSRAKAVKDDLDDLMNSGTSKEKEATSAESSKPTTTAVPEPLQLPFLTEGEEHIIEAVLNVLRKILENESVQQAVWKHQRDLCNMIWQMGLLTPPPPPPPDQKPVFQFAFPSVALQQTGLEFVAQYLNDPAVLERVGGLGLLWPLVCTGVGAAIDDHSTSLEKLSLSAAALHVIRRTVKAEEFQQMLLHTLAPAVDENDVAAARHADMVHRLVTTVRESLVLPPPKDNVSETDYAANAQLRTMLLTGSLGSLSLFLTDEPSRAMLLRLTSSLTGAGDQQQQQDGSGGGGLLDKILHVLGGGANDGSDGAGGGDEVMTDHSYRAAVQQEQEVSVQLVLIRFLCHWVWQSPAVVHAILQSPHSAVLSTLVNGNGNGRRDEKVLALASLLLGLIMEYMGDDETACGGWTVTGLLQVLTGGGSGNISRVTSRLERFKKQQEDLPWTASPLEAAVWTAWYEQAVLCVRKRLVHELTKSGSTGTDDDDSEDEESNENAAATAGTATSSSHKSLRRLVSQQTAELDELRAALSKAETTISVQDKQLGTWKQRVESTPTELDEMLTETTTKNAELVSQVETLEATIQTMKEQHAKELQSKEEAMESLQKELAASQAQQAETRQDLESSREELTALSQAYSSLEEEYRRQGEQVAASAAAAAATAQPAAETPAGEGREEAPSSSQSQPQEQPQGEISQQAPAAGGGGSTEVATLRAALARQREDNKAAEAWMDMAVGKMTEFSNSNASLQQQVTSLRMQLQQLETVSSKDESSEQQQQQQVLVAERELSSVTQQLEHERNLRQDTEKQLEGYRVQIQDTAEALRNADADRGELAQRVDGLTTELDQYRQQVQELVPKLKSSESDRNDLLRRVDAMTAELERVRAEAANQQGIEPAPLVQQQAAGDEGGNSEVASLRQTIEALNKELEVARANLGSSKHQDQEEIYRLEARIRELESRLSEGLGSYTIDDIRRKDEEIAELQQSNDAAQEWMGKAVEHTQTLSEQIASLSQDNKALNVQVRDLGSQLERSQNASETIARLESDVQGRDLEINRISAELAEKESQLVQAINTGTEARTELEAKSNDEVVALNFKLAEVTHELQGKSSEVDALRLDLSSKNNALAALQQRNDELVAVSTRDGQVNQQENAVMQQGQSSYSGDSGGEKEQLASEIVELKVTVKNLEGQLEEQERDSSEVAAQWEEAYKGLETRCSELETELSQKTGGLGTADLDVKGSDGRVAALTSEVESLSQQLQDSKADATSTIEQWQSSHAALEAQLAALTTKNEGPQQVASSPSADELEEKSNRIAELASQVENLTQQLQENEAGAADIVEQWKASYVGLESRFESLQEENEKLKSNQVPSSPVNSEESAGRIMELTKQVEDLSQKLKDNEEQAMDTIQQWQASYNQLEARLQGNSVSPTIERTGGDPSLDSEEKDTRIAELEALAEQLRESEADASKAIEQWQTSYADLEAKFEALAKENEAAKPVEGMDSDLSTALAEKNGRIAELENQLEELTSQVEDLSQKLKDNEKEAMDTIQQWQASYNELEARLQGNAVSPGIEQTAGDPSVDSNEKDSRIAELEALAEQLRESEADASKAIEQWQTSYADLEAKFEALAQGNEEAKPVESMDSDLSAALAEKNSRIAELENQLEEKTGQSSDETEDAETREQLTSEIAELKLTVKNLEDRLEEQEKDAKEVEAQWEEAYQGLETRCGELETELSQQASSGGSGPTTADSDAADADKQLQRSYAELEARWETLNSENETLKSKLAEQRSESPDSPDEKDSRIAELSSRVEDLTGQLQETEADAKDTIDQWQESFMEIEAKLEAVLGEQRQPDAIPLDGQVSVTVETDEKDDRSAALAKQVEELTMQLQDSEAQATETIDQWESSYMELEAKLEAVMKGHTEPEGKKVDNQGSRPVELEEKENRIIELQSQVEALTQQMQESEADAEQAIEQWQTSYMEIEAKLEAVMKEHEDPNAERNGGRDSSPSAGVGENDNRIAELARHVEELTAELQETEASAKDTIDQWQESYTELEEKLDAVMKESEELRESKASDHGSSSAELEEKDIRIAELASQVETLTEQMGKNEADATAAMEQWQGYYAELEAKLEALMKERKENEVEKVDGQDPRTTELEVKDNRIAELSGQVEELTKQLDHVGSLSTSAEQWQTSYKELEARLQAVTNEHEELKANHADLGAIHAAASKEKDSRIAELASQVDSVTEQLQSSVSEASSEIEAWQISYSELESQLTNVKEELETVKSQHASDPPAASLEEKDNRIAELAGEVETLTAQIRESEADATYAISQWQESYSALESQRQATAQELAGVQSALDESETSIESLSKEIDELKSQLAIQGSDELAQRDNRIVQLSTEVESLSQRLQESEAEKVTSVKKWETSCAELQEWREKEELMVSREKGRIDELAARVKGLSGPQLDSEVDATATIEHWQALYADLASRLEGMLATCQELRLPTQLPQGGESESTGTIEQWENAFDELDAQVRALREEQGSHEAALEKKRRDIDELHALSRDASDYLQHPSLDASLIEQLADLNSDIEELKSKQSDRDLRSVSAFKDQLKERFSGLEEDLKSCLRERISSLSEAKRQLQSESHNALGQLADSRSNFEAETAALNSANAELERKVAALSDSLKVVGDEKLSLEEKLLETSREEDDRIVDLQNKIGHLEGEMQRQTKDAESTISDWELSYKALEDQMLELKNQVDDAEQLDAALQQSSADEMETLRKQLQEQTDKLNDMDQNLLHKQKELDQLRTDTDATIHMWKVRVEVLETEATQLREDFDQQETDATEAIASWESQYYELEQKLSSVIGEAEKSEALAQDLAQQEEKIVKLTADLESEKEAIVSKNETVKDLEHQIESLREKLESVTESDELEKERMARKDSEDRAADLERKLAETEELFNSRLEASISDRNRVQESLETQRLIEGEQLEKLETERHALENEKAAITQERDMLKVRVAELVDELQEANDAMQLHVTNEVSDRATELAAEALREQVEEMTVQAEADQKEYLAERQARHFAEQEVTRLRADLVALLGMDDSEDNNADIHRLTVEAKGKLQRKEIAEIEELKTALENALDELSSARDGEQRAKEHAAKATLQTSMYEQELVTAKSDLRFLTETMDEMREAESTRRAALEYRASSLENDQDVMRRSHSVEVENLRNEVSQISMERDRLFQSLKESEISKENLLRASNREGLLSDDRSDPRVEVHVLRMEKAELLSAAAEEGTRVERRLHEAMTAEKSSSEAELILERELRRSAVRASENLKLELAELKTELALRGKNPAATVNPGSPFRANEVEALKKEIEALKSEKEEQQDRLANWKKESEQKMDRLKEDCRLAKARAIQLERDGRYEAEIRAEVSLLQSNGKDDRLVVEADPAEDDAEESTRIAELYDVIQKQKEAIEEERDVYFTLSEENEDLLAVLAQQDLLKESLNNALAELGGQEAVDAAIKDAEGKAIIKYGKYVKLT